jgi:hypothetical protein
MAPSIRDQELQGEQPADRNSHANVQKAQEQVYYDETTDEEAETRQAPQQPKAPPKGMKKFGQTMKNKMTGKTHEQRVAERKRQREADRKAAEQHRIIRAALNKASQTGQPQLVGRDKQGKEIYAQPPPQWDPYAGPQLGHTPYQTQPTYSQYGGGYGGGYGGAYGSRGYAAPMGPYGRRPGMGYGGGMGMPLMGGMMGGMLLGGLLF